jgi:hypothetical protein
MTMNTTTNNNGSGYSDETLGAMLKDHLRDCRLGHCNHPQCRRKADKRVASVTRKPKVAFDPGFDVGATLKDYLRDRRLGHFGHSAVLSESPVDFDCGDSDINEPEFEVPVILREDGTLDKRAMRMARLFGDEPLWN